MTRLPAGVRDEVLASLEERLGRAAGLTEVRSVGGGCINPSARIEIEGGDTFFLKWNADHPGLFEAEADGLTALDGIRGPRIPEVVGVGSGDRGVPGWLLLEFVPEGSPDVAYHRRLAEALAEVHGDDGEAGRSEEPAAWGWSRDNFIGSLPQSNARRPTWPEFWTEERIRPQLRRARDAGYLREDPGPWDELFRRAEELLCPGEEEGPSLLHGDLWSGNVYPGPAGEPVLIDPAVYRGHREVDLAMTGLFGGFGQEFYRAYEEAWPLRPGYREVRRHLYELYPLLVHVNLFGGGYESRARNALRRGLRGP